MNGETKPAGPSEYIKPGQTYASITDKISAIVLSGRTPRSWLIGFAISVILVAALMYAIGYLLIKGIGIWGINIPVAWGFAIINFVWWIGIGHAGTLISAILLLLHQKWRTSINRFAEAMTIFAVMCAGLFPLLHLGRPWFFYWLFPYPSNMGVWPQFRSPLVWDVFAVSTYFTVSVIFWYMGLIPDLGTMRDRAKQKFARLTYGVLALGWRGSARHWFRYESAYLLLAGLATPLVLSVHSVVSLDFTVAILPGWHSTIFPPYFVAGAIFSGFAMVLSLVIPFRRVYGLQDLITERHLDVMGQVMLATGLMVFYGYVMEAFMAWYSGDEFEIYTAFKNRMLGPYSAIYWGCLFCNCVVIQALWFKRVRTRTIQLWTIAMIVNIGMWLERFMIIVTALHRDFVPSSWSMYSPTKWDVITFVGSLGFFMFLMFLFIRFLPMISISETRTLVSETQGAKA
jgi:molybdopterin-containing oxidoreductase family membrane subunit